MGTPRAWQGASRRLIVSFVLVLLVPAAAVVWLGARLIEQDRAIASDQLRERRESAADLFIAGLAQAIAFTERQLNEQPASLPIRPDDDAVLVTLDAGATEGHPVGRLLYVPVTPPAVPEPDEAFQIGEALEYREKDNQGAAAVYRQLADMRPTKKLDPVHPGEVLLEDFLKPLGLSQYRVAKGLGVPPRRINEIVFGTSARFWLNLQTAYDLAAAVGRTLKVGRWPTVSPRSRRDRPDPCRSRQ